jgi:hypothetical protein
MESLYLTSSKKKRKSDLICDTDDKHHQLIKRFVSDCRRCVQKILDCAEKKESNMRVVSTLAIGNRRELIIVNCDGRLYLIGAGPNCVGSIIGLQNYPQDIDSPTRPTLATEVIR